MADDIRLNLDQPVPAAPDILRPSPLTTLPMDVLRDCIIHYLDAPSFLALCRTCTDLAKPDFRYDPAYWKAVTQRTFRVTDHIAAPADGKRWQKLYKNLVHNTRVFTWGEDSRGALGQEDPNADLPARPPGLFRGRGPIMRRGRPQVVRQFEHRPYPVEMHGSRNLGVIADLQCGGWSTTLLNSKGVLHSVGAIDGLVIGPDHARSLTPLKFPPGFPQPVDRYDPVTAIKQFSSGRSHVLALSDSGKIWSFYSMNEPGWCIIFAEREISEKAPNYGEQHSHIFREQSVSSASGSVRKVVAGWNTSSAYINGAGIILWATANRKHYGSDLGKDTLVIQHTVPIPKTNYIRPARSARDHDDATQELGQTVGEVLNYIVLEHFVVFVTDLGKFFAAKMSWHDRDTTGHVDDIVELKDLQANPETMSKRDSRVDIQGSFRTFAAFRNAGEVIIGTQDYLETCWNLRLSSSDPENPTAASLKWVPALQNSGVISIALGDYHYHALHIDGTISSYGKESRNRGQLGLGGYGEAESRLRGVRNTGVDGELIQHAYTKGRKIWFDEVKRQWVKFLSSGGVDPAEAQDRIRMTTRDFNAFGEVSEWIEQQGSDWDKREEIAEADSDGLGTHFALSVAAAGWYVGASSFGRTLTGVINAGTAALSSLSMTNCRRNWRSLASSGTHWLVRSV